MMSALSPINSSFASTIQQYSQEKFTGRLDVVFGDRQRSFFFRLGRLAWSTGGTLDKQRFFRIWKQVCGDPTNSPTAPVEAGICPYYNLLMSQARNQQLTLQQTNTIVSNILQEAIFDTFQDESIVPATYHADPKAAIDPSGLLTIALIHPDKLMEKAWENWEAWRSAGLQAYSPNLVPVLRDAQKLDRVGSDAARKKIEKIASGCLSLRCLAASTGKDVAAIARSLLPYVQMGAIELARGLQSACPGPKFANTKPDFASEKSPRAGESAHKPLIACVDDSAYICNGMQRVLEKAGYRFIGIQDPVKALPFLMENKPDLIFLDVVMPVVSGNELCTQLRRTAAFQDVPIILFTGSQGLVDRVRAKMVGASDLLAKPLKGPQIKEILDRYLTKEVALEN